MQLWDLVLDPYVMLLCGNSLMSRCSAGIWSQFRVSLEWLPPPLFAFQMAQTSTSLCGKVAALAIVW
jgi:hypothetical protein